MFVQFPPGSKGENIHFGWGYNEPKPLLLNPRSNSTGAVASRLSVRTTATISPAGKSKLQLRGRQAQTVMPDFPNRTALCLLNKALCSCVAVHQLWRGDERARLSRPVSHHDGLLLATSVMSSATQVKVGYGLPASAPTPRTLPTRRSHKCRPGATTNARAPGRRATRASSANGVATKTTDRCRNLTAPSVHRGGGDPGRHEPREAMFRVDICAARFPRAICAHKSRYRRLLEAPKSA